MVFCDRLELKSMWRCVMNLKNQLRSYNRPDKASKTLVFRALPRKNKPKTVNMANLGKILVNLFNSYFLKTTQRCIVKLFCLTWAICITSMTYKSFVTRALLGKKAQKVSTKVLSVSTKYKTTARWVVKIAKWKTTWVVKAENSLKK